MDIKQIFNPEAINQITQTLNEQCIDGRRLTRAELCHELQLTIPLNDESSKEDKAHNNTIEAVIGAVISMKVIPGFNSRQGKDGGIGKEVVETAFSEEEAPKKAKKSAKATEFPEGFIVNMIQTMDNMIKDKPVSRKAIAEEMTLPEDMDMFKATTLMTAAMQEGKLPGYASKPGVGGGFYRLPAAAVSSLPMPIMPEPVVVESNISIS